MYCSKCGNKLEDNVSYCPKCGNRLINNRKQYKPTPIMRLVIIINIVLLIISSYFMISSIGEKAYSVSTDRGNITLKINENKINNGIETLEKKGISAFKDMYVIYNNNNAKQYLLITQYNSKYSYLEGFNENFGNMYNVHAIDAKTGKLELLAFAHKNYGKNYVINKAFNSDKVYEGNIGKFTYGEDYKNISISEHFVRISSNLEEISSQDYVIIALAIMSFIAMVYWLYNRTKKKSTILIVIGVVFIIIQLIFITSNIPFEEIKNKVSKPTTVNSNTQSNTDSNTPTTTEKITETKKYEPLVINDTTGINGTYTDKEYALASNGGQGSSCSAYNIQNGKIEYWEEYVVYQGTYIQEDNKLIITYTKAYAEEQPIKLDLYSDELTIISETKLVKDTNHEFIKE